MEGSITDAAGFQDHGYLLCDERPIDDLHNYHGHHLHDQFRERLEVIYTSKAVLPGRPYPARGSAQSISRDATEDDTGLDSSGVLDTLDR